MKCIIIINIIPSAGHKHLIPIPICLFHLWLCIQGTPGE